MQFKTRIGLFNSAAGSPIIHPEAAVRRTRGEMTTTGNTHSLFTTRLASASHFLLLAIAALLLSTPGAALAQRGGKSISGAAQEWLEKYYLPLPAPGAPYGVYTDAQAQAYADEVFVLTNQQREKKGHTPLRRNSYLDAVAQAHAVHMAKADFFEHRSPLGMEPNHRIDAMGATEWSTYGENIAAGYRTPEIAVKEWMDSPGHRKAIRNERFREIGIGVYYDARTDYRWYWVQVFATFDGRYQAQGGEIGGNWLVPTGGSLAQAGGDGSRWLAMNQPGDTQALAPSSGQQTRAWETPPAQTAAGLTLPEPPLDESAADDAGQSREAEPAELELESTDDGPDWEAARPVK